MADLMTFPDTWEEFEQDFGFTDVEQVYTNGSRLIQSFRVKQWLDHISDETKAETDTISRQALMKEFSDFVRASNSSDFAQTPTWNDAVSLVGSMPSAQPEFNEQDMRDEFNAGYACGMEAAQSERKKGKWIEQDDGWYGVYYECSVCKEPFTLIDGTPQDNLYNFCPNCGAEMER